MKPETRLVIARIAALLFVLAIGALAFYFREHLQDFSQFGYLGVFLLPLLSNATVFVPVPGIMVIFTMAAILNPVLVGVIGGLGAAFGELTGYLLGFSGQGLAEQVKYYDQVRDWMVRHNRLSDLMIAIFAAIPNPFFDAAGIAAGSLKVPVWRFLIFCSIGSIIKMSVLAWIGHSSINWLYDWYWGPPPP